MPRTKPLPNLNHQQALNLCRRQRATINRLERQAATYDRALDGRLKDLSESMKERDHLAADVAERDQLVEQFQEHVKSGWHWAEIFRAQITGLQDHLTALAQRYAGVKLDTQQFTFAQAQEWLRNENAAVAAMLNRIVGEASSDQCAQKREAA